MAMQDPELRRLWEELERQRKDLDWILGIVSQRGPVRPIKNPHELLERVHDLEQDVAALKRLLSDRNQAQGESDSPPRRAARRSRYAAAFLARAVRRPLELLLRKHPRS
jgi:hypothetical protein